MSLECMLIASLRYIILGMLKIRISMAVMDRHFGAIFVGRPDWGDKNPTILVAFQKKSITRQEHGQGRLIL